MDKPVTIDKRYFVAGKITEGGFGVIHKGFDLQFNRMVVIKQIHHFYSKDQKFIDMFQDEAMTTAQLNHPNIINVYDLLVTDDRQIYIIMEYIDGIDMRTLIQRGKIKNRPLPVELGVFVIGEVCKALEHAHNKADPMSGEPLKIIHRDISPSNIMVTVDGVVKVIDFGIAKARIRRTENTEYGVIKGKLNYMSPEQIDSLPQDQRSDLFSLGIVLFEVMSGEKLFQDDNERILQNKVADARIDTTLFEKYQIPAELRSIIIKAVQKAPEDRYQSAKEMHRDLSRYLQKVSPTDLSFRLSEFVREFNAEEKSGQTESPKAKVEITNSTENIVTHSFASDRAKKQPPPTEPGPSPSVDPNETLVWRPEETEPEQPRSPAPVKPIPGSVEKPTVFRRLTTDKSDYRRWLTTGVICLSLILVLFFIADLLIGLTRLGKPLHYRLFPLTWEIKTVPPGAMVIIAGDTLADRTPLVFRTRPGNYPIRLQHAGFAPMVRTLEITPKAARMVEYVFQLVLQFESQPGGAVVFLGDIPNPDSTPCKVLWPVNQSVNIRMQHRQYGSIEGFTFQGIAQDPKILYRGRWKYEPAPGLPPQITIRGYFKPTSPDTALKKITVLPIDKMINANKLKSTDIFIKLAHAKDFKGWEHLSWYYRRNLPDTLYYWQLRNGRENYRSLYIRRDDPKMTPHAVLERYKLNDFPQGLKYLVYEKIELIDQKPVMTLIDIFSFDALDL